MEIRIDGVRYFTLKQMAELTGFTYPTIRNMVSQEEIKIGCRLGRSDLISSKEMRRFMQAKGLHIGRR